MNGAIIDVVPIETREVKSWLLNRHYAKRLCPISFAFGGYNGTTLVGIVTYGVPVSSSLRSGLCGAEWQSQVLELNRLCCENSPNVASRIVGQSLQMLPKPSIVVSFADTEQGHVGYVYQATNFLYTGLSAKRTDWKIRGMESLHGATIADKSRGMKNRAEWMRQTYGDAFYLKDRSRKHRYVFFSGDKRQRGKMLAALKYAIEPYPKGETRQSGITGNVETQTRLLF